MRATRHDATPAHVPMQSAQPATGTRTSMDRGNRTNGRTKSALSHRGSASIAVGLGPLPPWTRTSRPPARDRLAPRSCIGGKTAATPSRSSSMHRAATSAVPHYRMWRQQITRASEAQERVVQAGVAFPADAEPAEVVQPGDEDHHPAHAAESRAVVGAAAGDHRFNASAPQLATVLVVVMAAIGDHRARTAAS